MAIAATARRQKTNAASFHTIDRDHRNLRLDEEAFAVGVEL
ncbi:MAG: hypothetical protein AAF961_18160 [Planctomycetota bacterium]